MENKLVQAGAVLQSTGKGFLRSEKFQQWFRGTASELLICHGQRT